MSRFLFNIFVLPFFYFISLLPFWIIYPFSSFCYVILYHFVAYRKRVVFHNLRQSFPERSEAEITHIAKQFYLHFCDVIFESIKLLTISKATFKKRCVMDENAIQTFEYFFANNQSIVGVMGHSGNWEWGALSHQVYFSRMITGVYHPLSNKNFDAFMLHIRSRFGGDIIPMHQLLKRLITLKQQNISTTIGLIADQTAPPESAYWGKFLNQDTAFYNGPEKLAKRFNYPVIYLGMKKTGRGYYTIRTKIITEQPNELPEGEISRLHVLELENDLKEQPFIWLWSHRRWKHKKPEYIKIKDRSA